MTAHIHSLLEHIGNFRGVLKEENRICIRLATYLKEATLTNKCPYVWFHIANEGKASPVFGALVRAIGKIAGVPDYIFVGSSKCLFLEIKAKTGKLSPSQKHFKMWCEQWRVPYEVAYSYEEAVSMLGSYCVVSDSFK